MRLFLSFALLATLLAAVAVFSYFYWDRILIVFGIKKAPSKDLEAQDGARDGATDGRTAAATRGRGGGNPPASMSAAGEVVGVRSMDSRSNQVAAPMIVVASNDASRGNLIPYDTLAEACGNWDESRCIGRGGAAVVYRAELPRYGPVAVKRFSSQKEGSDREWMRELDALGQCRHPHILEIIGSADEGPENLIVMPLMEGGTLKEALPKLWWATRVLNLGQVVRALSFLHGKSILHRDVKSSNILLDKSLRHTRLADFGLAKDQVSRAGKAASHGTTGVVVGSPGYMAPELMMRPATEKTDAYATGVVLLEALTGLPAWDFDENGTVLTDRAVENGIFVQSLVDTAGQWPAAESEACGVQAVALTLFDPSQRKTLAAMEQDPSYVQHLERASSAETNRYGEATSAGFS